MIILNDDAFNDDTDTMNFSPGDDLFVVTENVIRLTVTDADGNPLMIGIRAMKHSMSSTDVARSNGGFLITDAWWHVCSQDCVVNLASGQYLVEADGTRWHVLTPPSLFTDQTRWKCASRQA
jgi:hypothetical protein